MAGVKLIQHACCARSMRDHSMMGWVAAPAFCWVKVTWQMRFMRQLYAWRLMEDEIVTSDVGDLRPLAEAAGIHIDLVPA